MPSSKLRALLGIPALMACQLAVDFPSSEGTDENGARSSEDAGFDAATTGEADAAPTQEADPAPTQEAGALEGGDESSRDAAPGDVVSSTNDAASAPKDAEVAACGAGCQAGERCVGEGAAARCVQCTADADCAALEGKQCLAGRCVQCDRGALADASDDQGCTTPGAPICDVMGRCVACRRDPNDCPAGTYCNGSLGCLRCDTSAAAGSNGCPASAPVCRSDSSGQASCSGCRINQDCGAGRYCDTPSGVCTDVCDPGGPLGDNGCSGGLPYCRATGGKFACSPCSATDCSGATPYCSLTGPTQGRCVACQSGADCATNVGMPVCDVKSGTCRAPQATDCVAPTPLFVEGVCVECATDANCAAVAGRRYCDAAKKRCVGCTGQTQLWCAERNARTPHCETSTGECVTCRRSTDCSARLTPSRTPICNGGVCVACNTPNLPSSQVCTDDLGGAACIASGPEAGRCDAPPP